MRANRQSILFKLHRNAHPGLLWHIVIGFVVVLICLSFINPAAETHQNTISAGATISGQQSTTPTPAGSYHFLGTAQAAGGLTTSMIGPGATAANQMLYLNYTYVGGILDVVAVDPNTGKSYVYPSPISSEQGAWGLGVGPDNSMYIGTFPNAHLLKLAPGSNRLIDLGQIPPDPASSTPQSYIWQITTSPHDHKVYACTYPSADLISYNPLASNAQMLNLGSMDPTHQEMFVHACMADPDPNSPYIYLGLGDINSQLVAYNITTHAITSRIILANSGFGRINLGVDGGVYGLLPQGSSWQQYLLSGGLITPTARYIGQAPTNVLHDGSTINVTATSIIVIQPNQVTKTYPYTYRGENISLFRIGAGPNGKVYAGSLLPYDLFSFDPRQPASGLLMQGQVGGGQPYSLLAYNQKLYIAAYGEPLGTLEIYDPSKPLGDQMNPVTIPSEIIRHDLRSEALVEASNNHLYVGAIASYGELTGPLIDWNPQNNSDIQEYFPIQDQGVSSLAVTTGTCQGSTGNQCLIGGTTIYGGEGTTPKTSSAQLFSWDMTKKTVIHQYTIPNVTAPILITDLVTNPINGYVYGIARTTSENYLFTFNPATGAIVSSGKMLPFGAVIYNSAAIYQGKIWGLSYQGVFNINLNNVGQATLIKSPEVITTGFALQGNSIYFATNSGLWSFTLPYARNHPLPERPIGYINTGLSLHHSVKS